MFRRDAVFCSVQFSSVALKKQCAEFSPQCVQCGVHLKCSAAQFVFISFAAEQVRVLIGGEGKGSEEEWVRRALLYTHFLNIQ